MRAALFKNNQSQAVRLPKQAAFPESVKQVEVVVQGNARVLLPAENSWDSWFETARMPEDFMAEREQPQAQVREQL